MKIDRDTARPATSETQVIGSITAKVITSITLPLHAGNGSYGEVIDRFIVDTIKGGNRIVGFELSLNDDAANDLFNIITKEHY